MAWLEGTEYFWVVLCKNRGVHNKYNLFSRHAIPLAEADAVSAPPEIGTLTVRCDDCGEEDTYEAKDVLRAEMEDPGPFTRYPVFENVTSDHAKPPSASDSPTIRTSVAESIRTLVAPYLRFLQKETPPLPRWRRKNT